MGLQKPILLHLVLGSPTHSIHLLLVVLPLWPHQSESFPALDLIPQTFVPSITLLLSICSKCRISLLCFFFFCLLGKPSTMLLHTKMETRPPSTVLILCHPRSLVECRATWNISVRSDVCRGGARQMF